MSETEQQHFFDLGTQYYIAARYSAFAGFLPVSGNLFHHAVEMYLKGHLVSKLRTKELKGLRHRLREIWDRFKSDVSDITLDCYDEIVAELDKFESIRYPDNIVKYGMMASIAIRQPDSAIGTLTSERPEAVYGIVVEDIDRLVEAIFQKSSSIQDFSLTG